MTERVSFCCGAPELLPGMCAACREWTSFEAEAHQWAWSVGDRVQRRLDVFEDESEMRHGEVTRRYSGYSNRFGYYAELYDVRWDDGREQHAFLSHGLEAELPDTRHADWARTWADVGLAAERGAKL